MRTRIHRYLAIALIGMATAACGSSSTSSSKPASHPSAEAQIKRNWASFFSPSTSATQKEALLQNGKQFAAILAAAAKNPLASGVSAKVTKAKLTGPTTATVTYTVSLDGNPVLKNATGTAVKSGDNWLVGDVSFCQLLKLEGASAPACTKA